MTTREFVPRLDRQISHEVTTTVEISASMTYAYDAGELTPGDRIDDGEWRRDSDTELAIGLNDSNGVSFPDLIPPLAGAEVAFDGATATILTLTGFELLRNPFGQLLGILLTFDGVYLRLAQPYLSWFRPEDADGHADGHTDDMGTAQGLLRAGLLPGSPRIVNNDSRHEVYREG